MEELRLGEISSFSTQKYSIKVSAKIVPLVVEMRTEMTSGVISGEAMDKMVIKTLDCLHKTVIYVLVKNLMDYNVCIYYIYPKEKLP